MNDRQRKNITSPPKTQANKMTAINPNRLILLPSGAGNINSEALILSKHKIIANKHTVQYLALILISLKVLHKLKTIKN